MAHKPSTAKHGRKKKPKRSPTSCPLTQEDITALDAFCAGIDLDEINLPTWEICHEALDLTLPVFITASEAKTGLDKTVAFCRTSKAAPNDPGVRSPATCLITLPPGVRDGDTIVVKAEGDRLGESFGNLRVIIRISSRT